MNPKHFDAIVIGSGTSAYFCISKLQQAGKRIAVVDERPYGGTCALRGCQPKKYLVANAEARAAIKHLLGKGFSEVPTTNWEDLQAWKGEFLDGVSEGEKKEFQAQGIETFDGKAVLSGPNEVTVGTNRLEADHIVLATGAIPRKNAFEGADLARDSEYFLNLETLPERILFIGGGFISFEFAHVSTQAGAKATILHRSENPLKAFEPELVETIVAASRSQGIEIGLGEEPAKIEAIGNAYQVTCRSGSQFQVDLVIESTGRVPNLSVLEGDQANVASSRRGVEVDEYMQSTTNPAVYAIGDCAASGYQLAPVADEEGKTAGANILAEKTKKIDYGVVPSVVFTIPNLASVGLKESEAAKQGLDFRINKGTTKNWPSSKRIGETESGYKVLVENGTNRILGAHLARHNAGEVINIFALAMKHEIKSTDLADFMWAYPTYSSDLKYMVK